MVKVAYVCRHDAEWRRVIHMKWMLFGYCGSVIGNIADCMRAG